MKSHHQITLNSHTSPTANTSVPSESTRAPEAQPAKLIRTLALVSNNNLMRLTVHPHDAQDDGAIVSVPRYIGFFSFRLHLVPEGAPNVSYVTRVLHTLPHHNWCPSMGPFARDPALRTVTPPAGEAIQHRVLQVCSVPVPEQQDSMPPKPTMHDVSAVQLADGMNTFEFIITRQSADAKGPKVAVDRLKVCINRC
jgi:hypothetical protein